MKKITKKLSPLDALELLIFLMGGQVKTAEKFGIKQASISGWKKHKQIPINRVLQAVNLCSNAITKHQFRPDFFDKE